MIRFILLRKRRVGKAVLHNYETILVDCPDLEAALSSRGYDQYGHDFMHLIGAEVVKDKKEQGDE